MLKTIVLLSSLALSVPAAGQTFSVQQPTSCPQTCKGERGPAGKDGRDGVDGKDGRDGVNGRDGKDAPERPRTLRPFDLGLHGINFAVRAVVADGAQTLLLVYEPSVRAAALVDVSTGMAQVALNFDAEIGPDTLGRVITFDDVQVLGARSFAWWHRGAVWSHNWNEALPWVDLKNYMGLPLFRWR